MAKANLITRLLKRKPRLDHPIPEKRLIALADMTDGEQATFVSMARGDEDEAVRIAALKRVAKLDAVAEFLEDPSLQSLATEIIGSQVDVEHPLAQNAMVRQYLLERVNNSDLLVAMASQETEPSKVAEVLFSPESTEIIADAVAKTTNLEVLTHCERFSRNREKSIYRNVKERIGEVKKLQSNREETLDRAEQLIMSATRASAADNNYDSLRTAQEAKWQQVIQELEGLNDELHEFGVAKLDLHMLQTRFPKRARSHQETEENPQRFAQIIGSLKQTVNDPRALDNAEQEWLEALRKQKAPVELSNEFFDLISGIRNQFKRSDNKDKLKNRFESISTLALEVPDLSERSNWPELWLMRRRAKERIQSIERFLDQRGFESLDGKTQSEWREQLTQVKSRCSDLIAQADSRFEETVAEINEEIPKLATKLEEGASKTAISMERHIRNLILRLPENARRKHYEALAPSYAELKQFMTWKSFATQPKREELCERIETLRDNPLEPSQHFEAVKSLRAAWNALGTPSTREDTALQRRYDLAAEQAWEVCEAWFEEQNRLRQANAEKKIALARELETMFKETNWEEPDWKYIQNHLFKRREQFRAIGATDKSKKSSINKRFYEAHNKIRERVIEHKESTAKAKEGLIDQAKALCEDEALEQKVRLDSIRALQKEWKAVGATFRVQEERLWKEFQEICNSAFDSLRVAREERKQTIGKNIDEANEVVSKLLKDAKANGEQFSPMEVDKVESKLEELLLPTHVRRSLQRKLAQVDDILANRKHAVRQLQLEERLKLLLEKDTELAGFESSDSPIPVEWFDAVQSDSVWFESRMQTDNEDTLRDVVLRAEIAGDIPPANPQDDARRLELRVGELASNLKIGQQTRHEVAEQLVRDWVGHAHGEQPLRTRFQDAMEIVLKNLGD